MATKNRAEVTLGLDDTEFERGLKKSEGTLARFKTGLEKKLRGISLKDVGKNLGAGFAGAAAVTAVVVDQILEFEDALTSLAIQANLSAAETDNMRNAVKRVSTATGIAQEDVLGAADALVNLEGIAGANVEKMELLAKASLATGAPMKDLAGVSFALKNAFGLTDPASLERGLNAVIDAGKQGSIPLGEMATVLQQVAVTFSEVSAQGPAGAAQLSAALQVAREGFGSAAEAGTGLNALIGSLTGKAKEFRKFGVKVFDIESDGTKVLKPINEILDQIGNSRLAKDPNLLQTAFGSSEALKFFKALDRGRDRYDELAATALRSNAIQEDSQKRLNSQAQKYKQGLNDVKLAVQAAFTPEAVQAMVEALKGFAATLGVSLELLGKAQQLFSSFVTSGVDEENKRLAESEQGFVSVVEDGDKALKNRTRTELRALAAQEDAREAASLPEHLRHTAGGRSVTALDAPIQSLADAERFGTTTSRLLPEAERRAKEAQTRGILADAERTGILKDGEIDDRAAFKVAKEASGGNAIEAIRLQKEILARVNAALAAQRVTITVDRKGLVNAEASQARNQ